MKLSPRLEKILELVDPGELLIDIGTDHAYIPIEAVSRGIVREAFAADISDNVIMTGIANVNAAGLNDRIKVFKSDGFSSIPPVTADTVVITGMGGRLIKDILSAAAEKGFPIRKYKKLILGPQSEPEVLRHYLIDELMVEIISESFVYDSGVYYIIMKADTALTPGAYTEEDYLYGLHIDPGTLDTYIAYLKHRLRSARRAIGDILEGRYGISLK